MFEAAKAVWALTPSHDQTAVLMFVMRVIAEYSGKPWHMGDDGRDPTGRNLDSG
jgi:hypothetical protein